MRIGFWKRKEMDFLVNILGEEGDNFIITLTDDWDQDRKFIVNKKDILEIPDIPESYTRVPRLPYLEVISSQREVIIKEGGRKIKSKKRKD